MRAASLTRVAFVGDPVRFAPWVLSAPAGGLAPLLVAPFADDARARLEQFRPDAVVVLDVDAVPSAVYADLPGAVILGVAAPDLGGYGDVPPTAQARGRPPLRTRAELRALAVAGRAAPPAIRPRLQARQAWRRGQAQPPADPWHRLVALDPAAARGRALWRQLVPPVDDRLFTAPAKRHDWPRVLVLAPSTAYREQLLTAAKHEHDVRHLAHGVTAQTLGETLASADVAIAVRPRPDAGFEHAIALHLAAGQLVITETLDPAHGLEPDIDVLLAPDDRAISRAVATVRAAPDVHHRVRIRGHQKAERFRASRVWPALIADLLADVEAFGG